MPTTDYIMTSLYFEKLTQALRQAGVCTPALIIDKERFDKNIDLLTNTLSKGFDYRIVAKSLPSIPMLQYIMRRAGTVRLMSFHLPFLMQVIKQIPSADILMGKPLPVCAARHFYAWHGQQNSSMCFAPELQLQWLIDSPERADQYEQLAKELGINIRISLEVDIGLHRGGFKPDDSFVQLLEKVSESPYLTLAGLMGYDAHVSKLPAFLGGLSMAFQSARSRYKLFTDLVRNTLGEKTLQGLCINTGGSSTYSLYDDDTEIVANEIATASALVKPTDFDVPTLDRHLPAAFISSPVLKRIDHPEIPEAPKLSAVLRWLRILPKAGCYIYGGNWLASPCYPESAKTSSVFGRSSNQEFYQLEQKSTLKVDDYMFFRPTQSEAVFLQFGQIAVYEDGKITEWWPVLDYPDNFPQFQIANTRKIKPLI